MQRTNRKVGAIKREKVSLSILKPDSANVRRHSDRNLDAIKRSLKAFGQQKPVIVGADDTVIAGNGMVVAATALGWTEIEIIRSKLQGKRATAYAIADNRTAELATWDDRTLAEVLGVLKLDEDFDHLASGFTDEEINVLLSQGENLSPEQEWVGMPEFVQENRQSDSRIIIHFRNPEDRQAFAECVGQAITEKTRAIWYPEQPRLKSSDKGYVESEA